MRLPFFVLWLLDAPPSGVEAQEDQQCDVRDINECLSSPCDNGATCLDSLNGTGIPHREYRCSCLPGFANGTCAAGWLEDVPQYTGLCSNHAGNCDVALDECLSSPCAADEACVDLSADPINPTDDAFRCKAELSDPCASNPCLNGATCSAASLQSDGSRQWVLECTEGVPVVGFAASGAHAEIAVFDGGAADEHSRIVSCGGDCAGRQGCESRCTTVRGRESRVTVAFSGAGTGDGEVAASYACEAAGTGRRLQSAAGC